MAHAGTPCAAHSPKGEGDGRPARGGARPQRTEPLARPVGWPAGFARGLHRGLHRVDTGLFTRDLHRVYAGIVPVRPAGRPAGCTGLHRRVHTGFTPAIPPAWRPARPIGPRGFTPALGRVRTGPSSQGACGVGTCLHRVYTGITRGLHGFYTGFAPAICQIIHGSVGLREKWGIKGD